MGTSMAKLSVVTRDGTEHEIEGDTSLTVMENIRDAGFDEQLRTYLFTDQPLLDVEDAAEGGSPAATPDAPSSPAGLSGLGIGGLKGTDSL